MDTITEVFLEDWDDAKQTRQKCDARILDLEQQGFRCEVGLFYNILSGKRIYLIEATWLATPEKSIEQTPHQKTPHLHRPKRVNQKNRSRKPEVR
ncbi:hypothetical protein ACQ4M3_13080 [Leptolyngbya sp. AN03gr2]|uniref:hypothetical protein n=1 Tax=unclassified Leptolyngbya TaxID=2650499 RepID=UPI003D31D0A1